MDGGRFLGQESGLRRNDGGPREGPRERRQSFWPDEAVPGVGQHHDQRPHRPGKVLTSETPQDDEGAVDGGMWSDGRLSYPGFVHLMPLYPPSASPMSEKLVMDTSPSENSATIFSLPPTASM